MPIELQTQTVFIILCADTAASRKLALNVPHESRLKKREEKKKPSYVCQPPRPHKRMRNFVFFFQRLRYMWWTWSFMSCLGPDRKTHLCDFNWLPVPLRWKLFFVSKWVTFAGATGNVTGSLNQRVCTSRTRERVPSCIRGSHLIIPPCVQVRVRVRHFHKSAFFFFLLWGVELNLKVRFTGPGSFWPVKEVPAGARRTLWA